MSCVHELSLECSIYQIRCWWSERNWEIWTVKSIKSQLLNRTMTMNCSNIISDNYCSKSVLRQLVPEAYAPKKSNANGHSGRRWDLRHSKHIPREACANSDQCICCWDCYHDLELGWSRGHVWPAGERELWHHLEWAEVVRERSICLLHQFGSLEGNNWHSGAPENYWTPNNIS